MTSGAIYDAAFADARHVVEVGELWLPTGWIIACDPFFCGTAAPFDCALTPGRVKLRLLWTETEGHGKRVALARLDREPACLPVRWTSATAGGQSSYTVNSGLACFIDKAYQDLFASRQRQHHEEHPTANYYVDVLAAELRRANVRQFGLGGGSSAGVVHKAGAVEAAIFSSGMGDGRYSSWWGVDRSGEPMSLLTDFGLL